VADGCGAAFAADGGTATGGVVDGVAWSSGMAGFAEAGFVAAGCVADGCVADSGGAGSCAATPSPRRGSAGEGFVGAEAVLADDGALALVRAPAEAWPPTSMVTPTSTPGDGLAGVSDAAIAGAARLVVWVSDWDLPPGTTDNAGAAC
jgi:hypothetical protein